MKRLWIIAALCALLTGCGGKESFETMQDVYAPGDTPKAKQVSLTLPKDTAASAMEGTTGTMYFCDGYEIALETVVSGDVSATIRALTGYSKEDLLILQTKSDGVDRYECAWVCAGESGDQVGRLALYDDGAYHYCLTVTALADEAGSLHKSWGALFESFRLVQS